MWIECEDGSYVNSDKLAKITRSWTTKAETRHLIDAAGRAMGHTNRDLRELECETIPATPGQEIVRIWIDPRDMTPRVERWAVIAWRVYPEYVAPVCFQEPSSDDAEFVVRPDGWLIGIAEASWYPNVEAAQAELLAKAVRKASEVGGDA